MRLSIVIRTYNRLEYLVRTILSIYKKSGLNDNFYEIIVVDQGSTDGTREWLKSIKNNGYYPVRPVFTEENVGDGRGMQIGIEVAKGEFISQHDDDIEIYSPAYYRKLVHLYEFIENNHNICALGGSHKQGINIDSAPFRFAKERDSMNKVVVLFEGGVNLVSTAWCTASFIFRKKFTEEVKFGKGMCNSFCGEWFDKGYENFICEETKFWHIDSTDKGGEYVQKQHDKFPSYEYVFRHYKNFVKEKKANGNY